MLQTFLKDSITYAAPSFVTRGLGLCLLPLYTRVLSPADYGSLDLLTVFASIVSLTVALEVSQGLARFYTDEKDPNRKVSYASTAFWFAFACYTVFALFILAGTDVLALRVMGQPGLETAFQIGIIYIWTNGLFCLIQNQFRWELRSKEYALVSLAMSFSTAAASLFLTYALRFGLEGLLIGMVVGSSVGSGIGLWRLRSSFRLRFEIAKLQEMLAFSAPLVFSSVAVWVTLYVDRIMINHFLSIDDVGRYAIGYRLASIAGLGMVGFQLALTPLIYAHHQAADTPSQLAKIFRIFLAFALLMFLAISLFSVDIVRLVTTEPFYGGAAVVIYLVPAVLLSNMYIFAPGIAIEKKTHYFIWINTLGALINIYLNYQLIPALGIHGAGLASMLAYLAIFSTHMLLSQRLYHVPHRWKPIIALVVCASGIAWWMPQFIPADNSRWAFNLIALVFFATLTIFSGLIRGSEIRQVIALASTRLNSWVG